MLSGENNGIQWSVEVKETFDGRFYALVSVAGKKQITHNTYKSRGAAQDGGCYLLSKTLAALGVG